MNWPIVVTCSCGVAINRSEWSKLPLVGFDIAAEPGAGLEIRSHTPGCGSSQSRRVPLAHVAHCVRVAADNAYKAWRRADELARRVEAIHASQLAAGINTHTVAR